MMRKSAVFLRFQKIKCKIRGFGRSLPPLLWVKNAPPRTLKCAQKVDIFDKIDKLERRKRVVERCNGQYSALENVDYYYTHRDNKN